MKIAITKRPLASQEINILTREMRKFPFIGYIDEKLWKKFENTYVATQNNSFVGVCVVFPLKEWVKIGPLIICNKFQGKGYGDNLLSYVVRHNKHNNLFIGSANPKVWYIADKLGFWKTKNVFRVPFEIFLYLLSYIFSRFSYVYVFDAIKKRLKIKNRQYYFFLLSSIDT